MCPLLPHLFPWALPPGHSPGCTANPDSASLSHHLPSQHLCALEAPVCRRAFAGAFTASPTSLSPAPRSGSRVICVPRATILFLGARGSGEGLCDYLTRVCVPHSTVSFVSVTTVLPWHLQSLQRYLMHTQLRVNCCQIETNVPVNAYMHR